MRDTAQDKVVKRFVGEEHEVMFRVLHNGGCMSFNEGEPKIIAAARALAKEGYLVQGENWPCAGRAYYRFHLVHERVSMAYLKEHL